MKQRLPLLIACATVTAACGDPVGAPSPTTSLTINVAPLDLPGIDYACYDLLIENGASPVRDTVIQRGDPAVNHPDDATTLCSSRFGNASGGDISYIAPCDAQAPLHQITLWVDGLYTLPGGAGSEPERVAFQDPCPSGCAVAATCVENADTPVAFNLTIMRPALQGFFDVALNFNNIFCSSKFDTCYAGDPEPTPINLLFGDEGQRAWTGVFGFACTAGPGADVTTNLMYSKIAIVCDGEMVAEIAPDGEEGNHAVTLANGSIIRYGVYRGLESLSCQGQSCNKAYWNLAFNLEDIEGLCGDCRLQLAATAADLASGEFAGGYPTTPGLAYPYIEVDALLTQGGQAFCQQNPLNACSLTSEPDDCEANYGTLAEAIGFVEPPAFTSSQFQALGCPARDCIEGFLQYAEAVGGIAGDENFESIFSDYIAEYCCEATVGTVYHGGLTGSPVPQMCWEFSGDPVTAIAGVPFPLAWSTPPSLEAAPECAAITADKAAVLGALGQASPSSQQLNLGPVDPACLPEGALSVASVETALKLFEADTNQAPGVYPHFDTFWRFFTPSANTDGLNLQVFASIETTLKALEQFEFHIDLNDRAFMASIETYLKYAEAAGAGALQTLATSCGVCGVAASVETWLKYGEAVGLEGGYQQTRTVLASVETFLTYAEAVDLGNNLPPCSDCGEGRCHVLASVETFLMYAEAMGVASNELCSAINIVAGVDTYLMYAEAIGTDIGGAPVLVDDEFVLDGFSLSTWEAATAGLTSEEVSALLEKGVVKTGTPELDFLFEAPFDEHDARDRLLDKGLASCEAGEPQEALATLLATLDGVLFDDDPAVFDGDGDCTANCNGTLVEGIDRLLGKGMILDGFDSAPFLASLSDRFDHVEGIDRLFDKGVAACGLDSMTDIFDFASNAMATGDVYAEVLDSLLDKGAFHGRQRSVFSEAFPWLGAGGQSGGATHERLLDVGVILTGDNQPALRWLLGLGFPTGPLSSWEAEIGAGLDRGVVLLFEGTDLWLRSVDNYLLP